MRQRNVPSCGSDRGFTLIEVMVAAAVLMVGVLGTLVMLDGANQVQRDNTTRTSATALARDILEAARALEYESIAETGSSTTGLVSKLRTKASLGGRVEDGKWIINRRGVDFTVVTTACTFDDPADGIGSPAPASPCPAGSGAPAGTTDTNPDDFRRVIVTLQWLRAGRLRELAHTTQIVNPGGGLGPRINTFADANGGVQIGDHKDSDTGPTTVELTAESTIASTVRWAVDDGRSSGLATATEPGGKLWEWEWNIGTVDAGRPGVDWALDGSYAANAQAFDYRGVPGELRVANVLLNRRQALAPKVLGGGRSGLGSGGEAVVEMDWVANLERDVIGYRVYRLNADGTKDVRLCPSAATTGGDEVTKKLSCTDPNPPSSGDRPIVKYAVYAVDRPVLGDASSGTHEGDAAILEVGSLGERLDRPTSLTVTTVNGRPKLSWVAPVPTAGSVLFYRIYRDDQRYANTVSDATTFTDTAPTKTTHDYYVSAVHSSYNEGQPSAEVTWP